jgi:MFS family permease
MSRLLLTFFGALVCGASSWVFFGFVAASIFSKMPGGAREGGGAMAGLFIAGPIFGLLGLSVGGWLTWRVMANPERTSAVSLGLAALLVLLVVGTTIALQPTIVERDDYPGRKAAFDVEVSFPAAEIQHLAARDRLEFEMRSADGTEIATTIRAAMRHEGDRAVIPGTFSIRATPRSKLLAVMKNDRQVMCSTLTVDGPLDDTTDWSAWQPMEEGLQARWRLVLKER